jgi:hypothetical protein
MKTVYDMCNNINDKRLDEINNTFFKKNYGKLSNVYSIFYEKTGFFFNYTVINIQMIFDRNLINIFGNLLDREYSNIEKDSVFYIINILISIFSVIYFIYLSLKYLKIKMLLPKRNCEINTSNSQNDCKIDNKNISFDKNEITGIEGSDDGDGDDDNDGDDNDDDGDDNDQNENFESKNLKKSPEKKLKKGRKSYSLYDGDNSTSSVISSSGKTYDMGPVLTHTHDDDNCSVVSSSVDTYDMGPVLTHTHNTRSSVKLRNSI